MRNLDAPLSLNHVLPRFHKSVETNKIWKANVYEERVDEESILRKIQI